MGNYFCACGHRESSHMHTSRIDDMRAPCNRCDCRDAHDVAYVPDPEQNAPSEGSP